MYLDTQHIAGLAKDYRTTLVNSIAGFKSANLVGTVSSTGNTNLCIVNSVFHLGAHPPLLGMIFRPHSVPRDTLENILATGVYTINHVHSGIYRAAHQTSARYPRETSEFAASGLREAWLEGFAAPFVAASTIRLAMTYRDHQTLAVNNTVLVAGEITGIHCPDEIVGDDGYVNLEQAGSLAVIGLDSYHSTRRLDRLAYAKPGREPASIL